MFGNRVVRLARSASPRILRRYNGGSKSNFTEHEKSISEAYRREDFDNAGDPAILRIHEERWVETEEYKEGAGRTGERKFKCGNTRITEFTNGEGKSNLFEGNSVGFDEAVGGRDPLPGPIDPKDL